MLNSKKIKNDFVKLDGIIYNIDELIDNKKYKKDEDKIMYLFKKYNTKLFNMLNGDFILVIHFNNILYLVKDRVGTKFLYYYLKNDNLYFTDDLREIINIKNNNLEINKNSLGYYLTRGFICAPNTIFNNVYKLEADHMLNMKIMNYPIKNIMILIIVIQ